MLQRYDYLKMELPYSEKERLSVKRMGFFWDDLEDEVLSNYIITVLDSRYIAAEGGSTDKPSFSSAHFHAIIPVNTSIQYVESGRQIRLLRADDGQLAGKYS